MSDLVERFEYLKEESNAVVLAHNYQRGEVQDAADYVGDSLGLSMRAAETDADVILFCGVDFMAESAKILNPEKTVLMPDPRAECPMAAMITAEGLSERKAELRGEYGGEVPVVCYVNTSAAVKAESDVCCTSSNAVEVVDSLDTDRVLFVPDSNLAEYVGSKTDKEVLKWDGYCPTHDQILRGDVLLATENHPDATVLAHPECRGEVLGIADHVSSTSGILGAAREGEGPFIVGTENGIIHRLRRESPGKEFVEASRYAVCPNMKLNTLESMARSLENVEHVVEVEESTRKRALAALERMLEVGRGD
ncbi:MAG: Quinolinate synthase A [Methanonatronarchaeales archaeon]|nr:Quinolinate synthase A [Methanonatronarchaeales archaeon]